MKKIILASASPRRKELMKNITSDFSAIASLKEEDLPQNIEAEKAPLYLAEQKAQDIFSSHPDCIVIGCDTVVIIDDKILGKPKTSRDAYDMLSKLSGNTHKVITGCCILSKDKKKIFSSQTLVKFYPLCDDEIYKYIDSGDCFDKAGAYGIQSASMLFVERIEGDFFNVVGLPVARLKRELEKFLY